VFWEGGLPFAVAPARDGTERNRAEAALREREERFHGTFENAAVGIGHRHLGGHFLRVNQKFCSILGYPRDELLPRTGQEITHPEVEDQVNEAVNGAYGLTPDEVELMWQTAPPRMPTPRR
jgi:PAS domain-containing protein